MRRIDLIGREHGRYPHTPKDLRDPLPSPKLSECVDVERMEKAKSERGIHIFT